MKIKKSVFILVVSILFFSCSQDDSNNVNSKNDNLNESGLTFRTVNYQLEEKITITKTTSKISKLLLDMGVVEIKVSNEDDLIKYSFVTEKKFGINGEGTDFKNYTIVLSDGAVSINSNPNIKLTILEDQPYILTPTYKGFINSEEYINDRDFNLLYVFMNELIMSETNKLPAGDYITSSGGGCSFWNTHYVYATGGSVSVAEANLPGEIAHYTSGFNTLDISGCRAFGGVDSSCVWGNHLCIATQAFCCD